MKIGIFFDDLTNVGGGFYLALSKLKLLTKINDPKMNFECFVTTEESFEYIKKEGIINLRLFRLNISRKILFFLFSLNFVKRFSNYFGILNPLENILNKEKFDLLVFVSPSSFVRFCDNINFIYNIWETQHRNISYFPEYKKKNKLSPSYFDIREQSYKFAVDKAFKIIVDTEASKKDIISLYNCREELFEKQAFVPTLPKYYESIKKNVNFDEIFSNLNIPKKKIFFYPAQFWPHKNHRYIIDSIEILKNEYKNKNFQVVFCGKDKGNKKILKNIVEERKLSEQIIFYEFLSLDQVISLYLNCSALIMPTYVGRSSLPLRESFYFKKPVFYTKNLLDEEYSKFVVEIDIYKPQDLAKKLLDFLNSEEKYKKIIEQSYHFYLNNINDEKIYLSYKKMLFEFDYIRKRWSN